MARLTTPHGDVDRRVKQAPTTHEIDMLFVLLLWICLVLGMAVGSYQVWVVVQGLRRVRMPARRLRQVRPDTLAGRMQQRSNPGSVPQYYRQNPAPRTSLPAKTPDA
jgi:hypothetical protein